MTLALPKPVADYFAAEKRNDPEALSSCFAPQSRVQDEGRTIVGTAAIAQWMIETKKQYQHTVEPLSAVERDGP